MCLQIKTPYLCTYQPSHQYQTHCTPFSACNPSRRQRGAQWPYIYTQTQYSYISQASLIHQVTLPKLICYRRVFRGNRNIPSYFFNSCNTWKSGWEEQGNTHKWSQVRREETGKGSLPSLPFPPHCLFAIFSVSSYDTVGETLRHLRTLPCFQLRNIVELFPLRRKVFRLFCFKEG